MLSISRIYQYIWDNKRRGGSLYLHMLTKVKRYKKRGHPKDKRGLIVGRVDISQRPLIVEKKDRLGDLEIDLTIWKNHKGALLTINDRTSGVLFMEKKSSKEAAEIEEKTIELLQDWKPLIKTITSDNGKEFANHRWVAEVLDIDYYFTRPYHSWERVWQTKI